MKRERGWWCQIACLSIFIVSAKRGEGCAFLVAVPLYTRREGSHAHSFWSSMAGGRFAERGASTPAVCDFGSKMRSNWNVLKSPLYDSVADTRKRMTPPREGGNSCLTCIIVALRHQHMLSWPEQRENLGWGRDIVSFT